MKLNTIQRKKARGGFEQAVGREEIVNRVYEIIRVGKQGLDGFIVFWIQSSFVALQDLIP